MHTHTHYLSSEHASNKRISETSRAVYNGKKYILGEAKCLPSYHTFDKLKKTSSVSSVYLKLSSRRVKK